MLLPTLGVIADDTTAPTVKPVDITLTYTFSDNDTANLKWDKVPGATKYIVTRTTGEGQAEFGEAQTVNLASLVTTTVDNEKNVVSKPVFPNLSANDRFTIKAVADNDVTVGQGSGLETDVVRAPTEFGLVANIGEYAQRVMKYVLPIGITLGILMTIYAGVTMMLSQGSPDKIKDAQEAIQGAILGLVILILTRLIVDFLYIPSIDATSPSAVQQAQQAQQAKSQAK